MSCPEALSLVDQIEALAQPTSIFDEDASGIVPYVRADVERLCAGNPGSVGDITTQLTNAGMQFESTESQGFDTAQRMLFDWQGDAADNFKGYLDQAHDAYNLVKTGMSYLNTLYDDYQKVVTASHADLVNLLQKYQGVLSDAASGNQQEATSMLLTVAYVALSFATGATGTIPLLALTGQGVISVAQVEVSASSAGKVQILNDLIEALGTLDAATTDKADGIKKTLDQLAQWFSDGGPHLKQVQPAPPTIITAPDFKPQTFNLVPAPALRHPVATGPLLAGPGGAAAGRDSGQSRLAQRLSGLDD